jgi:hypothetical protein
MSNILPKIMLIRQLLTTVDTFYYSDHLLGVTSKTVPVISDVTSFLGSSIPVAEGPGVGPAGEIDSCSRIPEVGV